MAHGASYTVKFRRRRDGKTNYKRRLNLLKSGKPRFVVRKSNLHILIQLVKYGQNGDAVIVQAHTNDIKKLGWKHSTGNIPAAYLAGVLCAKNASKKGVKEAVADLGMASIIKGGRLFAAVKGAVDGGLSVLADETAFPKDERVMGAHISSFKDKSKDMSKDVESIKTRIIEGK